MLETKDIVGIFDLDVIENNAVFNKFYNKIKEKVEKISNEKGKSLILLNDNRSFISNISSITLEKRAENMIEDVIE